MNKLNLRRENFIRLANIRTNDLLRKIRILGNLSMKSRYEYSDNDVNKIFSEIDTALKQARSRFRGKNKDKKFIIE